jgi:hypothetical protein
MPLPSRIQNAPEVEIGLGLFLNAFYDLDSCRPVGWEEGPIPWTAMAEYCLAHDIHGEQREALLHHVRALDLEYLKYRRSKRPKSQGGNA